MEEGYSFTIINKEGIEVTCDVISVVTDKDNKVYLLYTDYLLDENKNFRLLVSELVQNKDSFILEDVEDQEKLNELIKSVKKAYIEEVQEEE